MTRCRTVHAVLLTLCTAVPLAQGCARPGIIVPPLTPTPTAERHVGKWVWFDLLTHDAAAAERFYAGLFGWEFAAPEDGGRYTTILHQGRPIAGLYEVDELPGDIPRARWIPYVSVDDVDAAVALVRGRGGSVFADARDLEHRGRIAVLGDPQGAVFGVVDSSSGDPPDLPPPTGAFLWNELWTHGLPEAVDFYHALVGYSHVVVDFPGGGDYDVLQSEARPRAGVIESPFEEVLPNWLPYVLVDDPVGLAARVESLGGRVLLGPHEELRRNSVAIVSDPSGAAITLQKWPIEGEEARGFPQ